MNHLKNRVKDFICDRFQWGTCLINGAMSACMAYFYFDSGRKVEPLAYLIFFLLYTVAVFLIGRKAIPTLYLAFSAGAVQDITFINCTVFLILLGVTHLRPKLRVPVFLVYALEVFVVCFRHSKSVWHLLCHFLLCGTLYIGYLLVIRRDGHPVHDTRDRQEHTELELTGEEERIVRFLSEGKMLKEIGGLSKNTKTKYLKTAMKRNSCSTKEELIARYTLRKM